jgi:hypothetical protein
MQRKTTTEERPKKRPVKKPVRPVSPRAEWKIDWYALGLLILALITFAPYVAKLFHRSDVAPVVQTDFTASKAKVADWFSLVGSDSPSDSAMKYVEALRSTASKDDLQSESVGSSLKENFEALAGQNGWLDWSLFSLEFMREMQSLEKQNILKTPKDRSAFVLAIAESLEQCSKVVPDAS